MNNKLYKNIIDFMYSNDCWFEQACDILGHSSLDAKLAEERFNKEIKEILES